MVVLEPRIAGIVDAEGQPGLMKELFSSRPGEHNVEPILTILKSNGSL